MEYRSNRAVRRRRVDAYHGTSQMLRIRIKALPALRYEGFDLAAYQVGETYDVERPLADLLIERGYAEPDARSAHSG